VIAWALLWSAALAGSGVDCSKVEPAPAPDPAAARAYLEVGDGELREGRAEEAAVAFREAVRLDPSSAPARARLLELCWAEGEVKDEDFERAARAVEDGRYEDAAALLGPRYRAGAPPAPATALLYGITLYERGDDEAARAALERARESPETEDGAAVFLGLLAMRAGDSERAAALFDRAERASQGELGRTAGALSVLARRETKLAVSLQADGGYDSNVSQVANRTSAAGDLFYGATASALLRPFGERGPYADAGVRLKHLIALGAYNLGWAGGALGYRLEQGRNALRAEYAYDGLWLGGTPFLSAHQVEVEGRMELSGVRLGGLAAARAEAFRTVETAPYSGPTFDGELSLGFAGGPGELRLRYRGELHRSVDEELSWLDHGPGARATAAFPLGRLVVDAQATARTYGGPAPVPGSGNIVREDVYLEGTFYVEHDVSRQLTFYLAFGGRRAFSNQDDQAHTRLAGGAGAIFTAGLW